MESNKLTSRNPFMNPNRMTQKLVTYSDYNKLWDDTKNIEDVVNALGSGVVVADIGGGNDLTFAIQNGLSSNLILSGGVAKSWVSAFDYLRNVSYGGDDAITYAINKVGSAIGTYYSDPKDAILALTAAMAGTVVLVEVHVKHGLVDNFAVSYVEVQDNLNIVP